MTTTISAQALYDRREERAEISGNDLHEIFRAVCDDGDPSPSGSTRISTDALRAYAQELRQSRMVPGGDIQDVAAFCEHFASDGENQ